MPRYVLDMAYKGTRYHGWQIQENAHTVQAELEKALFTLMRRPIGTMASGRTDMGVHAEQQYVQFDLAPGEAIEGLIYRLNALLPSDLAIKKLYQASDDFSARHDARSRTYEYRISRVKNPFLKDLCCHFYGRQTDLAEMNKAGSVLKEYSDFESFSKVKTQVDHFLCEITHAEWQEREPGLVFTISANRFLRGMVRAIAGTMLEIGQGKIDLTGFRQMIESRDRRKASYSAPPEGLFLCRVEYPEGFLRLLQE